MYELLFEAGPLDDNEIAEKMNRSTEDVIVWTRAGVEAGFLYRDEFGRYSSSCPWPRIGF
jgi:predicted transcriptional regulator